MHREYHKWRSSRLERDMELLIHGHGGLPVLVFPTSGGRFFEFEDRGLVHSLSGKIDAGQIQLFCVDSVDMESWYNRGAAPRWRIVRHTQYEEYLLNEVLPLVRQKNANPKLISLGCSFGGFHAANIAFRHPDIFTGMLSMSGAFDMTSFLHGYHDDDVYFHTPTQYLENISDPWCFERFRSNTYVLATGWDDQCLGSNQQLDQILTRKEIPHQLYIWDTWNSHDWPTWKRMLEHYL